MFLDVLIFKYFKYAFVFMLFVFTDLLLAALGSFGRKGKIEIMGGFQCSTKEIVPSAQASLGGLNFLNSYVVSASLACIKKPSSLFFHIFSDRTLPVEYDLEFCM